MFPPVYYELAQSKGRDLERRLGQRADRKLPLGTRTDGDASATVRAFALDVPSDPVEAPGLAEIRLFPTRVKVCAELVCTSDAAVQSAARHWEPRHRPA